MKELKISRETKEQIIYDIRNGELIEPNTTIEKVYFDETNNYEVLVHIEMDDEYCDRNFHFVISDEDGNECDLDENQACDIFRVFDIARNDAYESAVSDAKFKDYLWGTCLHM